MLFFLLICYNKLVFCMEEEVVEEKNLLESLWLVKIDRNFFELVFGAIG